MKKIVIYGAGHYAKKLYCFLKEIGCVPEYFVQSKADKCETLDGINIIDLKTFAEINESHFIFVAIQEFKVVRRIVKSLIEYGVNEDCIFDFSEFIEQIYLSEDKGNHICILCKHSVATFLPWGIERDLFYHKGIIGSGYRENVKCPVCGCIDRTRWVYWILKEKTDIFVQNCSVLHIAPEHQLKARIKENVDCDYYAGDINLKKDGHRIDVTNIQFKDEFFDYIIMNHVLEHIAAEERALQELKRVLKKEGKLILSFPVCLEQETFEDSSITAEEDRLKFFGQEDHVRLYGNDYQAHIEAFGYKVQVMKPEDFLDKKEIIRCGLIENDVVLICKKH